MTATDVDRGLSVERSPGTAPGWRVVHEGSGLSCGVTLRLKAEARQFRTELLATGCDFTAEAAADLRKDAHWTGSYRVMLTWRNRDITPHYDPLAPRMMFAASYDRAGLIHVTNMLAGMTGQHHVHDQPSWEAWVANVSRDDIVWLTAPITDCGCGEPVWQPPVARGVRRHARRTEASGTRAARNHA